MPNRPKAGSGGGGGRLSSYLWDVILGETPEDRLKRQAEYRRSEFDYEQQQKIKADELERAQTVNNLAKALVAEDPSIPMDKALAEAENFMANHGKQAETLGRLGAAEAYRKQQLDNEYNKQTLSDRVRTPGLENTGKEYANTAAQMKNQETAATIGSEIEAKNALNELNARLNAMRVPYASKIVADELNKATLGNETAQRGIVASDIANRLNLDTLPGKIAAENSQSEEIQRKTRQNAALNAVEQASKAYDFARKNNAPGYRYESVVQPSDLPGQLFSERLIDNPNFKSDDLFGGGPTLGPSGDPNGTIRLQDGRVIAPPIALAQTPPSVGQTPSAPAVNKEAIAARAVSPAAAITAPIARPDIPAMSNYGEFENFYGGLKDVRSRDNVRDAMLANFADHFGVPPSTYGGSTVQRPRARIAEELLQQHPELQQQFQEYEQNPANALDTENFYIGLNRRLRQLQRVY